MSIAIIDYGMGNLHSISKALQHVAGDQPVVVTDDAEQILNADRVVFPGVGAIRDCISVLQEKGLDAVVKQTAQEKPFLGICLGMQALLDHDEENDGIDCLGIIPGTVNFFGEELHDPESGARLKVPHMGWNQVQPTSPHPMWQGIAAGTRFYFVHSYYVQPASEVHCAATTQYPEHFASAVAKDNIFAVQFHPEKSHDAGLTLLKNFTRWDGSTKQ